MSDLGLAALACAVALCQGIGGALEKKGLGHIVARLGEPHVSARLVRTRFPALLRAALTTPTFVLGVFLAMLVGGPLLLVALSMGDGAKTGLFIGALASCVYVAANLVVNGERLRLAHVAGIASAGIGGALLALAGLRA